MKEIWITSVTVGYLLYCDITACTKWIQSRCMTEETHSDDRHQVKVLLQPRKLLRQPNEVLMDMGEGGSQSRSSSYSAVVTDRKPQVDVMAPANLLSCLLPLHNWGQINVIFALSRRGEKYKRGAQEVRWRWNHLLSPNRELLRKKTKQGNNSVAFSPHGAQTTPRIKSVTWYETPWCLNVKKRAILWGG